MTATEELRLMLNESGVDWDYGITGATTTRFNANGVDLTFTPMRDGLVCSTILTPEQAIDAALGSCNCSNNCTNSERTGTCLPYFWTHDGVLHIELPKLPDSIQVRLPDERDREVRSARTWQYTLGVETCHIVKASRKYVLSDGTELFEDGCSVCNGYIGEGDNYCPNCGRRIEVDE